MADRTVLDEIAAERRRQIEVEGWTSECDDQHDEGQMAMAASCYATVAAWDDRIRARAALKYTPPFWSLAAEWWKPTTRRRDLIKAGALIVAEIERLDRAAQEATDVN